LRRCDARGFSVPNPEDNPWKDAKINLPPQRLDARQEMLLGRLFEREERLVNDAKQGDSPLEVAVATMVVMRMAVIVDLAPERIIPPCVEDSRWPIEHLKEAARVLYTNSHVSADEALVLAGLTHPRDYSSLGPLVDQHPGYYRHVRRRIMLSIVAELVLLPDHEWIIDQAKEQLRRHLDQGLIDPGIAAHWEMILRAGPESVAYVLTGAPSREFDELRKHSPFMRLGLVTDLERRAIIRAIRGDDGLREEGAYPPRVELSWPPGS